jgi:anti-sigma regulatory factor (Ser/Thr protein kinase)
MGIRTSRGMLVHSTSQDAPTTTGFLHQALIYDSVEDFVEAALPFVRAGIEDGEPVLARVKRDNAEALTAALGDAAEEADVAPAEDFYETPSRTRAKFLDWVDEHGGDARVRVLSEPPWPLDSEAGIREWERHESVVNLAFSGRPVSFACPYDARSLPGEIVDSAESTHPSILRSAGTSDSSAYTNPEDFCDKLNAQAPVRSGLPTLQMPFDRGDLRAVRELVEEEGSAAGLGGTDLFDMTLAVDEVATNAILHGSSTARLKLWREPGRLVWEVSDTGPGIRDPLAGQIAPDPMALGGRGLWMARMICDSLEFRSDGSGTVVALYVSLPAD